MYLYVPYIHNPGVDGRFYRLFLKGYGRRGDFKKTSTYEQNEIMGPTDLEIVFNAAAPRNRMHTRPVWLIVVKERLLEFDSH